MGVVIVQAFFNMLILFLLAASERVSFSLKGTGDIVVNVLKTPILVGTILGVLFSYFQIHLPYFAHETAHLVSESAPFIALFALGFSLHASQGPGCDMPSAQIGVLVCLKTLIHPFVAWGFGFYCSSRRLDLSP